MDEQNPRDDEMDDRDQEHLVDRTEVEEEFEDIEDKDEDDKDEE